MSLNSSKALGSLLIGAAIAVSAWGAGPVLQAMKKPPPVPQTLPNIPKVTIALPSNALNQALHAETQPEAVADLPELEHVQQWQGGERIRLQLGEVTIRVAAIMEAGQRQVVLASQRQSEPEQFHVLAAGNTLFDLKIESIGHRFVELGRGERRVRLYALGLPRNEK